MRRNAIATLATFAALAAAQPALASQACLNSAEARAWQVRQLHIQLQVASLNCREDDASLPGKYGNYVQRFNSALGDNAKILRGYFSRSGSNLDRQMTVMANEESQRAHLVDNYCEGHVPLFDRLAALKPRELEGFATTVVDKPDNLCAEAAAKPAATSKAAAKSAHHAHHEHKAAEKK